MTECLEVTADKFTFRVPTDRLYTERGLWVFVEKDGPDRRLRVGLTDYLQQRSGDIAFASVAAVGTKLAVNDRMAEIETVKAILDLPSPVGGTVVEVNSALGLTPERVNQDPYGKGWLAMIEPADWGNDRASLMEARPYLVLLESQVREELKSS